MALEDKIIDILKSGKPLKAREIATRLNQQTGSKVTKKEVNRILYFKLKEKVKQDSSYRWYVESIQKQTKPASTKKDTSLAALCSYYLDCLSEDMEAGISEFAMNKYGSPKYGQLSHLPHIASQPDEIYRDKDIINIIKKVKKDKNRLILQLGYPIYVRKHTTAKGTTYTFVEPLLLFPYDTQSFLYNDNPELQDEMPKLNIEAIKHISGLDQRELFEETMSLSEELGLNNPYEDQPEFEDVIERLVYLRPDWNWQEKIRPELLSSVNLQEEPIEGIYNVAALFSSERSKYTRGLEKELSDLMTIEDAGYKNTALGHWIYRNFPNYKYNDTPLVEPLPLNEEQKESVKKSLQAPLTVITGPPGTGKSQVVTSIVVNATYQRQKVLFASKNHKAVDVVNERVNNLASKPVMLRLGDDKLQAALARYLSNVLSADTTESDKDRYQTCKKRHDELIHSLSEIEEQESHLIEIRNNLDELEKEVEQYRDLLSDNIFYSLKEWGQDDITKLDRRLEDFEFSLKEADKRLQNWEKKVIWFIIKNKRLKKAKSYLDEINNYAYHFNLSILQNEIDEDSIPYFYELIDHIREVKTIAQRIILYFETLQKIQNQTSLPELARESKIIEEEISDNSLELLEYWLRLLPERLTDKDRKTLGDYVSLLNLIVDANKNNETIQRRTFAKYYQLLPKVTNILSCWAITSLSVRSKVPFEPSFFDLVVIDEASQCDIASALPLLYRAKRAVIIGDTNQLTHISSISKTKDRTLLEKHSLDDNFLSWSYSSQSLFNLSQTLVNRQDLITLKDHHRSHAHIINFSNQYFYSGDLRIATKYENLKFIPEEPAIRWIHVTGQVHRPNAGSSLNEPEANKIFDELKRLTNIGYKGSIGVVTPFKPQKVKINDLVQKDTDLSERLNSRDFLCDVVHKFQGDEKDIMIFSPVVAKGLGKGSQYFLEKTGNLFNVAITRARAALIVVGDKNECKTCGIKYMEDFTQYVIEMENQKEKEADPICEDYGPYYPNLNKNIKISDWEKILYEELYKNGIKTVPQKKVEQFNLDLALYNNSKKLDIEVDGENYHRNWDGELCKRDQLRNKRLIELGWDVMRFWVYEIRDDLDGCIERVRAWMKD